MRRSLVLICGVFVAMVLPATASATIDTAFNNATSPISCSLQATTNYRVCGASAGTTVPSFDGVPIDVTVTFPAATGSDNNYPLIGLFHGWGGTKIVEANSSTNSAKRWLDLGYAVFSMTDRGWGSSCGGPSATPKAPPCTNGYIHLMHNAFEVRDAQYLMGMLADDGLINPDEIGANGGSYGGGISEQLAMLKDRTQLANGQKVAWTSPADSIPMSIAAAIPEYTWSDLPSALMPNGSEYDYAWNNPYKGPNGDHRIGVNKFYWNGQLNLAGTALGYYAPTSPAPDFPDPAADIKNWFTLINTGGPYDASATAAAMNTELSANHSAFGIDDSATQPAPMLLTSGFNDDLFPASESLRLYNKIRHDYPDAAIQFYGLDYGHQPRSNGTNGATDTSAAAFLANYAGLVTAGNAWMDYYVKGGLTAPTNPVGGVTVTTSKCSGNTPVQGDTYSATTWANLAKGEVAFGGSTAKTIAPNTAPATEFSSGTSVCTDSASANDTTGSAAYTSAAAPSGGYTIAGAATVDATLTVNGANDQVIARLYDVDPTGSPTKEKLIARGVYRPLNVGAGATKQTFQLYPQAWKVETGHQLKLELLSADSHYMQTAPGQQAIAVSDLTLHVPTIDTPGGFISTPSVKILPAGYSFSQDVKDLDHAPPATTDNVPATLGNTPVSVTLTATDTGVTGVDKTYYTTGASPATPTAASSVYNAASKPVLQNGEKISYFSVDYAGNPESVHTSIAAQVDNVPPGAPVLIAGPPAGNTATSVTVSFLVGAYETSKCSLDGAAATACTSPLSLSGLSVGSHTLNVYAIDAVGNQSAPLTFAFAVAKPAALAVSVKLKGSVKVGKTVSATASSKAAGSAVSGVKYAYKWTAGKKSVGTKSKLKLTSSMKGKKISLKVTATKSGFSQGSKTITVSKKLK